MNYTNSHSTGYQGGEEEAMWRENAGLSRREAVGFVPWFALSKAKEETGTHWRLYLASGAVTR